MYCRDCRWFFADNRAWEYRRDGYCFCRKKWAFFSRNYRIGEGTRIAPDQKACPEFAPQEKEE